MQVNKTYTGIVTVFEFVEDGAVENEQSQHRLSRLQGLKQGGVVVNPQIAAEPVDG